MVMPLLVALAVSASQPALAPAARHAEIVLFVYNCHVRDRRGRQLAFSARELRALNDSRPTRWTVRFQDRQNRAEARTREGVPEGATGTTVLRWRDQHGGAFRAELQWPSSFGASGNVAGVELVDLRTGRSFAGACPASESEI
jgi:hypothetical protein